ncbi:DUF4249 domain-containing protein [Pedobacter sp. Du54]|uniref:DUF4249 domain-containing protein n=1 Tax=Pedobacter anseongensis TaxID=3133439 RepID=UPI0030ABDABA
MKNRFKILLFLLAILLIFEGCKKPFSPAIKDISSNVLVVEGLINSGSDSTIIKLSRTTNVSEEQTSKPEIGATVTVESESNETIALAEKSSGSYISVGLNLNKAKKYRLRIKTLKDETYLSDFVEVKVAPPIDQLNWKVDGNRVNISLNTHDDTKNSNYYRWEYVETWIFYSAFESLFKWNGVAVVPRSLLNEGIFKCWGNEISSNILLGSTAKLANDVIFENPITFVQSGSEKFTEKYSIIVKQYVLTKEAYQFWGELQKNTESLGSIFDSQPSQLKGNIHNIANSAEPVLGFVSIGTTTEKRIYIDRTSLPPTFIIPRTDDCIEPVEIKPQDAKAYFEGGFNIPVDLGTGASRFCVDCTLRGTNRKPAFWP